MSPPEGACEESYSPGTGLLIRIRVCAGSTFFSPEIIWRQMMTGKLWPSLPWWMFHRLVNIFHLVRVSVLLKSSKILYIFLEVEPGPCPKNALLFLHCSSLVTTPPPFPDQQLFEPALWNSEKGTQTGFCA